MSGASSAPPASLCAFRLPMRLGVKRSCESTFHATARREDERRKTKCLSFRANENQTSSTRRHCALRLVVYLSAAKHRSDSTGAAATEKSSAYSRQHHAWAAPGWLSADGRVLVAGQPARLFPKKASRRAPFESDESVRRQS